MSEDVYFEAAGVASVRWDEACKSVYVEWLGWANSAEFTALLEAELRALVEHHSSSLLADCRRQRVLSPADQDRANREWVPKAIKAGLRRFAIVLPASQLAAANLQERLAKVSDSAFQVRYFGSVEEAKTWIAEVTA